MGGQNASDTLQAHVRTLAIPTTTCPRTLPTSSRTRRWPVSPAAWLLPSPPWPPDCHEHVPVGLSRGD